MRHLQRLTLFSLLFALGSPACTLDTGEAAYLFANEKPEVSLYLNGDIIKLIDGYKTDGTHPFHWPADGASFGTTQELCQRGKVMCTPNEKGTHCCGIVLEAYTRAAQASIPNPLESLTTEEYRELHKRFFGDSKETEDRERLVQDALTSMGLGETVSDLEQARAGDLVQFWRHREEGKLSGHQAVFMSWVKDETNTITGMVYWSSQKSTNGVGFNMELVGDKNWDINRDKIFLVRPLRERVSP